MQAANRAWWYFCVSPSLPQVSHQHRTRAASPTTDADQSILKLHARMAQHPDHEGCAVIWFTAVIHPSSRLASVSSEPPLSYAPGGGGCGEKAHLHLPTHRLRNACCCCESSPTLGCHPARQEDGRARSLNCAGQAQKHALRRHRSADPRESSFALTAAADRFNG
jgi:hypothetical protein